MPGAKKYEDDNTLVIDCESADRPVAASPKALSFLDIYTFLKQRGYQTRVNDKKIYITGRSQHKLSSAHMLHCFCVVPVLALLIQGPSMEPIEF